MARDGTRTRTPSRAACFKHASSTSWDTRAPSMVMRDCTSERPRGTRLRDGRARASQQGGRAPAGGLGARDHAGVELGDRGAVAIEQFHDRLGVLVPAVDVVEATSQPLIWILDCGPGVE